MSRRQSRRIKKRRQSIKKEPVIQMPVKVKDVQLESEILLPPPQAAEVLADIKPMKNKVFIVGGDYLISAMFRSRKYLVVHDAMNADIICFTGGADVDPSLYGEQDHPMTSKNVRRDTIEKEVYNWALNSGKFQVGICRGGQFLNVMNGGEMWQHVDGHAGVGQHKVWLGDYSDEFLVTSTHHQMMRPRLDDDCDVLLVAYESNYKEGMTRLGGIERVETEYNIHDELIGVDHECVYYHKTGSLCFQPHPEYPTASTECVDWFFRFIEFGLDAYEEQKKKQTKTEKVG